jgi:hypothetical protein
MPPLDCQKGKFYFSWNSKGANSPKYRRHTLKLCAPGVSFQVCRMFFMVSQS